MSNSRTLKNPRQLAWELLYEVENSNIYSNLAVPKALTESGLERRDRGLVTEIVYGTLRMRGFCDCAIQRHLDRAISEVDAKVLTALRMGAYQLLIMKTPVHAAVNETVELSKLVCGRSASSFVNAVMRGIAREPDFQPLEVEEKYSHPKWIISALRDILKEDSLVEEQLHADNQVATPTLIPWPGRCSIDELVESGAELIPGTIRALSFKGSPGEIPAIRERRAGVQDLGSQIVVENFYATYSPNLRWLDLCAGPGGKAAYLDSLMENGELIVNEPAPERARLLSQVVKRSRVTSFDGREIPDELGNFDRILIDAPCTGIGALRRRPEVRWRRNPSDLRPLIALQGELLSSAASRLHPGGVIGYATCSPHLAETKLQIADFLKSHSNFRRVPVSKHADSEGDMQLWTYRDGTDAMFLSLLARQN